jgi:hypothetical protein
VLTHLLSPSTELQEAAARQLIEEGLASADAPHSVVCLRTASAAVTDLQEPTSEALWELVRRWPTGLLQTARRDHGVLLAHRLQGRRMGARRGSSGIGDPQRYLTAAAVS